MNLEEELKTLENENTLQLKPKPVSNGLTEDQNKALQVMNEWVYRVYRNKDEQNFFALRGSAGTGKTTLLSTFLKEIKMPYRTHRIVICAPTHKAKKVLQTKTKWQKSETLQSLLGLKLEISLEDFDINNPQFEQTGNKKMRDYDLVIIDEASMINTNLYETVVDVAKSSGTKVLFVGDPKQLNPVKEIGISPALISPVNQYELTQIVRQEKTNPLIILLDALRNDIDNNTSTFNDLLKGTPINVNEKGEGYIVCDRTTFANNIQLVMSSNEFKEDKNFCRYISWTNQSITETNNWIRNSVLKSTNKTLDTDEILLSYRTIADEDDIILTNSDDYIVEKLQENLISDYTYPIKTLYVTLRGIDTGIISKVNILVKEQENYNNYVSIFNAELEKAKNYRTKRQWMKFYSFKDEILLLDTITQNNQLLVKKDIDYGYGITIHKSQGSTYNTVFVNGKDINKNLTTIERKRLWYVAMSRASKIVYINL